MSILRLGGHGVSYPTAGPSAVGNGTSGVFVTNALGQPVSTTWKQSVGALLTSDQVTARDLTDRILDYNTDGVDPNPAGANYSYDGAGRLTSAKVFNATPGAGAPTATVAYSFDSSGGCGAATAAGRNSNRTAQTFIPTGGAPVSTTYCYDHADRLTSTTAPGITALAYDPHGNTSTFGDETHVYDIADRHVETRPAAASEVALIVGDPGSLSTQDNWFKNRLTAAGHTANVLDDNGLTPAAVTVEGSAVVVGGGDGLVGGGPH